MTDAPLKIPGLLADEWREPAADRAATLYRPSFGTLARLLAQTHKFAVEYLEQCPALIAFASWGYATRKTEHKILIARRFGGAVMRGPKLREIIEQFQGAYPLRKINGKAITGTNLRTLIDLRTIPPSELAQMIPTGTKQQERWLRGMRFVRSHTKRLPMSKVDTAWMWGANAITGALADGAPQPENQLHTIIDFIARSGRPLNPSWTFRSALEAAEAWHHELRTRTEAETFVKHHGLKLDDQVDYFPLPNDTVEFGGYEFTPLRSGEALFAEGTAMRHCVASYAREVIAGTSRIYSIRQQGLRIATLELAPARRQRLINGATAEDLQQGRFSAKLVSTYRIQQLKGRCNSAVRATVRGIAEGFVAMINGEK